jgi:hypothetical protein
MLSSITSDVLENSGSKVDHCASPEAIFKEQKIWHIGETYWWAPVRTNVTTGQPKISKY